MMGHCATLPWLHLSLIHISNTVSVSIEYDGRAYVKDFPISFEQSDTVQLVSIDEVVAVTGISSNPSLTIEMQNWFNEVAINTAFLQKLYEKATDDVCASMELEVVDISSYSCENIALDYEGYTTRKGDDRGRPFFPAPFVDEIYVYPGYIGNCSAVFECGAESSINRISDLRDLVSDWIPMPD